MKILILAFFVVLVSAFFTTPKVLAATTKIDLGTTDSFAVLGASKVTNVPTSDITGDVGLSPAAGSNITGLTCAEVTGIIYQASGGGPAPCVATNPGLLNTANLAETTAFNNLAGQTCNFNFGGVTQELATLVLVPGVYCATAFTLSGTLTLAGSGVWIFQTTAAAAALTTPDGGAAKVQFLNGIGSSCNVWWQVASSAALGTSTKFIGNILALKSITLGTGASLDGRALVQIAAVTLDTNTINAPNCVVGTTTITTAITTVFSGTATTVVETIVTAVQTAAQTAVGGFLQPINKAEVLSKVLLGGASGYWWVLVIAAIVGLAAVLLMRRSSSSIKDEPNVKDHSFDGIW